MIHTSGTCTSNVDYNNIMMAIHVVMYYYYFVE